jgi:uncharacterized protein YciI
MRFFILSYSRGPNWAEGLPRLQQPMIGSHLAYLRGLHEKSQLVMAGPFEGAAGGGVAIIQTTSAEDAQAIAQADRGVLAGTLRVEVTEWRLIVWDRLSPSAIEIASGPVAVSYATSPAAVRVVAAAGWHGVFQGVCRLWGRGSRQTRR